MDWMPRAEGSPESRSGSPQRSMPTPRRTIASWRRTACRRRLKPRQAARKGAIQTALRGATDVPLSVAATSVEGLEQAVAIARHGHAAAASDVGVAVALLAAGLHGARLNAEINVGSIGDAEYRESVANAIEELTGRGAQLAQAAQAALSDR